MRDYTVTNSLVSIGDGMLMRVHRFRRDFIDEGAPTFVLVHGIGVSSEYFVPLAQHLVEHGDVITLDLPGFGDTTRPPHPLSIAGFAAATHKIMRFEGVKNPVMLGHSMGAQVVTEMAARDPEWINRKPDCGLHSPPSLSLLQSADSPWAHTCAPASPGSWKPCRKWLPTPSECA